VHTYTASAISVLPVSTKLLLSKVNVALVNDGSWKTVGRTGSLLTCARLEAAEHPGLHSNVVLAGHFTFELLAQ